MRKQLRELRQQTTTRLEVPVKQIQLRRCLGGS